MMNGNTMDQLYRAILNNWPIILVVVVLGSIAIALVVAGKMKEEEKGE